jgi:aspartate racemase
MKTIGLLGGMSWESSAEYYRIINQLVMKELGGHHSAKCILYSVNFEEIEKYQKEGRWDEASRTLIKAAQSLEKAGADCIVLCTNTMHKLAKEIIARLSIPFIHIAHATANEILSKGVTNIGLIGTKYTMEQDFYRGVLEELGLNVIIPNTGQREVIHNIIYEELCKGKILPKSREKYNVIIHELVDRGAEGIILGCTEITLLVTNENLPIPLFDTTYIHALQAVRFALGGNIDHGKS